LLLDIFISLTFRFEWLIVNRTTDVYDKEEALLLGVPATVAVHDVHDVPVVFDADFDPLFSMF
jgi:hypothetical protein